MKHIRTLTFLAAASTLLGTTAMAASNFTHEFAPEDGLVAPIEKPYRSELCLNGSWQFQPVALPADFKQGKTPMPTLMPPAADGWDKTPIRIPSPWNANTFADQKGLAGDFRCFPSYPEAWNSVQMGWLRRSFTVPAAWRGQRLILHFGAVAGNTQVLVNGKPVGQHTDIFLPFDIDITDAVNVGATNELLVGVRKSSLSDNQGKYGRRTYQGGSMWGQHIAGIWQDVTLVAVPTVHISDVFVKPMVDQDQLQADVTIQNDTDKPAHVSLARGVLPWISKAGTDVVSAPEPKWVLGSTPSLPSVAASATIPAHSSTTVILSSKVGGKLKFWSPDAPNLYGLVCRVKDASGAVLDSKYTRFGWRQITFKASQVLLNGKRLVMKGDSWHFIGIPEMSRRYAWAWFKAIHDVHGNAVRLHAEPYPSFFLDVADEQGILVLDESAIWASDGGPKIDDPAFWADTEPHVQGLVLRDRNHPSVFGWSISNELMAVVRGVFHSPKEYQDLTIQHYQIWADICRKYDPTRSWISADGEDDGAGTLPTYVVHYGGTGSMERASKSGKPWGVGEAGPAYYGTPEQIAQQSNDERAYLSSQDRMVGVASVSYNNLSDQHKYDGSYRSVFNLVWYGLKPLELGLPDTTRPPTLTDGIWFPKFVEGKPGVQPERLGPYCTTLNPGYDPRLPLYFKWPLYDAIQDANADPPIEYKVTPESASAFGQPKDASQGTIKSVRVLAGPGGTLAKALTDAGVPVATGVGDASLVFVDGVQPPSADAKATMQSTLESGGTVFVWGASPSTLAQLNQLLPYPLELTDRTSSSLTPTENSPLVAGLPPSALYFSELSPSVILKSGLGGPLVAKSTTLLTAANTDWMRWNRQAETTKTVMLLRSERETKPSGTALADLEVGKGHLIVCNLPSVPETSKAASLNRILLANLGIALGDGIAQRNVLDTQGTVTRALAAGRYWAPSVDEALTASPVESGAGTKIVLGASAKDRTWMPVASNTSGAFDFQGLRTGNAQQNAFSYLSFWLYSPKALDNLLLDPHLPNLGLTVTSAAAAQVWLNGKSIQAQPQGATINAPTLLLQQGWNHVLVKVVSAIGSNNDGPSLRLQSSQADYLTQLRGAQEKP